MKTYYEVDEYVDRQSFIADAKSAAFYAFDGSDYGIFEENGAYFLITVCNALINGEIDDSQAVVVSFTGHDTFKQALQEMMNISLTDQSFLES